MKRLFAVTAALALLGLALAAQADVFNLGPGFTNLETVRVGDPGNVGELSGAGAGGRGPDRICGSVGYNYNIGKYEVTAKQYTEFLNAKAKSDPYELLYNTYMVDLTEGPWGRGCNIQRSGTPGNLTYSVANDWANRPVNYVNYWAACRFVNWLGNGQGNGDMENGAYTLNGYYGQDGRGIQRNAGAKWVLASEDEWYKAAYYKGGGTSAGYWDYPTQSNTVPSNHLVDPDPGNNATYCVDHYTIGSPYYRTEVGAHENSDSAYGTFDQGGNVGEWNETVVEVGSDYANRGWRGGAMVNSAVVLQASRRWGFNPTGSGLTHGFRVSEVPEPASIIALLGGLVGLLGIRRRRT